MNTATATKIDSLFAKTSTVALVGSALMLDAKSGLTAEERMVSAWTCDEIERRMGGIQDDAAFDALLDSELSYVEALVVTFPELSE